MNLNAEQAAALSAVMNRRSIFLTGPGGTGKTHTIHAIAQAATDAGIRTSLTALTGCAALLLQIRARTIHSWAGIGLARGTIQELVASVKRNKRAVRRWLDTQLLIIDEISMCTPDLFEKLDGVARHIRKQLELPFGGMQVVLVGDFCQLPPVQTAKSKDSAIFAFESPLWSQTVQETHILTQIVRQVDPVFQNLLNEARTGNLTPASIKLLEGRMGLPWQDATIRPTLLFTRNAEVDTINRKNLDALTTSPHMFHAQTITDTSENKSWVSPDDAAVAAAIEKLDSDAPYEVSLELRVGAQVMLVTNKDQARGLVNGSRGIIVGFTLGGLPQVQFKDVSDTQVIDREVWWLPDYDGIGRSQIPLRVAYACTIHKSQGASMDSCLVDIGSSTFEYGQAYVALSRVRSLDGLYVWKFDPRKIRCHPRVLDFMATLDTRCVTATLPEPTPQSELWITNGLSPIWQPIVTDFMASPTGQRLAAAICARASEGQIAPAPENVFAALRICPDPTAIKVIIIGQDPYHTLNNSEKIANGMAFSVASHKFPPSLQNIFKELQTDLKLPMPSSGDLSRWAKQGVLLLNDILTVSIGTPLSHQGLGWEKLTDTILQTVLSSSTHCVVIAWGRNAQKKLNNSDLNLHPHTIIKAPHPSPLSAYQGFFGSRPFSQTNTALETHGQSAIDWSLN